MQHPSARLVAGLLALPFVVVAAATRALTHTLHTFHDGDETVYHYPTVVRFAHELPGLDLVHYKAAQTPLLHVLLAGISKVIGLELWRLRLVEALISYVLAVTLFRLLRDRRGLEPSSALVLTLVVVLSPYVFAESFILITDNLALLFGVLALDRLERYRTGAGPATFALAAACAAGAVLTRQSFVFLFVVALAYLVSVAGRRARTELAGGLVALAVAALPMALLVLAWGGLVPIGSDSSSCGLCARGAGRTDQAGSGLFLRSVSFTLAIVGVYALVLFGLSAVRSLKEKGLGALRPAVPGMVTAAVLAAVMLALEPVRSHVGDAGWLWRAADRAPVVGGSSALFWLLAPAGAAALWLRLRPLGRRAPLAAVFFGAFVLVALSTRLGYQKYYDPYALLTLVLTVRAGEFRREHLVGAVVLALGSMVYALSFVI